MVMLRTFELPYDKVSSKGKVTGLVWMNIQWRHFGKGQVQQNTSSRDVWRCIEVRMHFYKRHIVLLDR